MNLKEFIDRVIDDGIVAVNRDYARPDQKDKRDGSIAGFEACRDKTPQELAELLDACRTATLDARLNEKTRYWWFRCYELEVEWVCNCVSVLLQRSNLPVIVPPTCRAVRQAAKIVGVQTSD